jgi:hypothetical protein
MADPPPETGAAQESGGGPAPAPKPPTPRWVKVFAIVFVALLVLIVVKLLTGGGKHGPGRHLGGPGDTNPPAISAAPARGPGWAAG